MMLGAMLQSSFSDDNRSLQALECLSPLAYLRREWLAIATASVIGLLAFIYVIARQEDLIYAWRWSALAVPIAGAQLFNLRRGLIDNHRHGERELLPSLGAGTRLSVLRGVLIAVLAGFLLAPRLEGWLVWLPGPLYTLAALADLLDGYLARKSNHATVLGERLDMRLDGLGVLVAALLAVQSGQAPGWYLLVGLARYLFVAGIWLRRRLGKPVYALQESAARRPLAGAQMGLLAVILWPIFSPPSTHVVAALFAIPFLAGFTRDWLAISGALVYR